jgi:hypothetical protein
VSWLVIAVAVVGGGGLLWGLKTVFGGWAECLRAAEQRQMCDRNVTGEPPHVDQ